MNLKLRPDLYTWLHTEAERQNRTMIAIVENALNEARLYK